MENIDEKNNALNLLKANIISWYDFNDNSNLLLIGSNLGEIEKDLQSKLRIVSISNLEENQNFDEKFDYILIKDEIQNLNFAKQFLNENGTIFLLVNNRFGITNFVKENNFEIIGNNSSNLYTKSGIERIINEAGFSNYKFFYPLPNYEITNAIFSDDYLPQYDSTKLMNNNIYENSEEIVIDELKALKIVTKDGKFKEFANSYLIEINPKSKQKFISYNNSRKEEYRLCTKISDDCVEKESASKKAVDHILQIKDNIENLKNHGLEIIDWEQDLRIFSNFMNEKMLYQIVVEKINNSEIEDAISIIQNWFNYLKEHFGNDRTDVLNEFIQNENYDLSKLTIVKKAYIDLVFENTFIIEERFVFFDQEWVFENLPLEFILYRAINNMYMYNQEIQNKLSKEDLLERFGLLEFLKLFEQSEKMIQDVIIDKNMENYYNNPDTNFGKIELLEEEEKKKEKYIQELTSEKGELEANYNLLKIEEEKKQNYIDELTKAKGDLEAGYNLLKIEEEKKQNYIDELTKAKGDLEAENKLLKIEEEKKQNYIDELTKAKGDLEVNNKLLKSENENKEKYIKQLEQEKQALQIEQNKKDQKIENLKLFNEKQEEMIKLKDAKIQLYEEMRIIKIIKKLRGNK